MYNIILTKETEKSYLCKNKKFRLIYWSRFESSKKERISYFYLLAKFQQFIIFILSQQKTKLVKENEK